MEIEKKHLQFKHPANILISGPSGSGKTVLVRNILKHFKELFYNLNKNKIKVLWSYGQWQPLLDLKINKFVAIKYIQNIPTERDIKRFNPDILIIDDMMNEMSKQKDFENIFIKKSHHLNVTVIFLV